MNANKNDYARDYLNKHGEGVSTISFQVENCEHAINEAQREEQKLFANLKQKKMSMERISLVRFKALVMFTMNLFNVLILNFALALQN